MELLFVVLIAFVIGLAVRYAIPGRDTYGVALVPAVSAVVAAILWEALTWAGLKYDAGWIWVISLAASGVVGLALALLLPRSRRNGDHELLQQLSRA
jgi:hypothetical protein